MVMRLYWLYSGRVQALTSIEMPFGTLDSFLQALRPGEGDLERGGGGGIAYSNSLMLSQSIL